MTHANLVKPFSLIRGWDKQTARTPVFQTPPCPLQDSCWLSLWRVHIRIEPVPSYLHHDQNLRSTRRDGGRGNRQPVGRPGVEERGFCGRSCWAICPMGIGNAVVAEHADLDHGTSGVRVAVRGRSP